MLSSICSRSLKFQLFHVLLRTEMAGSEVVQPYLQRRDGSVFCDEAGERERAVDV